VGISHLSSIIAKDDYSWSFLGGEYHFKKGGVMLPTMLSSKWRLNYNESFRE
jgi:hypothetical protein